MRSPTMSRRTRFLATGAVALAVGLGGGGLAVAASSGGAPALTPVRGAPVKVLQAKPVPLNRAPRVVISGGGGCKRLRVTPVYGVKLPKVTTTLTPVRVYGKVVVCGSRGRTSGR